MMLTTLVGDTVVFCRESTHRGFERNQRDRSRDPRTLLCSTKQGTYIDPIFILTDGCTNGISGVVSQKTN